jgi:ankyrin repeat protein
MAHHRGDPNKFFAATHPAFPSGRKTALMSAAEAGSAAKVRALVDDSKADVGLANEHGLTALHFASNAETVRALVERGADLHAKASRNTEPLALAVRRGDDAGAITELAAQGVDVKAGGGFAAQCCYGSGKAEALAALIALGEPVDGRSLGEIMIRAILSKNLAVVRVLCEAGANLALKSNYYVVDGNIVIGNELMTPLAAAIRNKLGDIEAVLREHGAPLA